MKYGPTFFPTHREIEIFHNIVITLRGEHGYVSKGLVKGALEWAMTDVYNFIPFPSLLSKAAAIMYAYTCFHPYSDGNKRTALLATSFFLELNACSLEIPNDAPEFARELAMRTIDTSNHDPMVEIRRVEDWLRRYTKRPFSSRFNYAQMASEAIKEGLKGDVYLSERLMSTPSILMWGIEKADKLRRFLPGKTVRLFPDNFALRLLIERV